MPTAELLMDDDVAARPTAAAAKRRKLLRSAARFAVSLFFLGLAFYFFNQQMGDTTFGEVLQILLALPNWQVTAGFLVMAMSYFVLSRYDVLALKHIGKHLSSGRILLASFITYTFNFNLGSIVGAVGMRYYMYSLWGLSAADITRVTIMAATISWLGYCLVAGLIWTFGGVPVPPGLAIPVTTFLPLGLVYLALAALYFYLCTKLRRPLHVRNFHVELPAPKEAVLQCAVAAVQWLLPTVVLYVLMPDSVQVDFLELWSIHLLAAVAGAIIHVPGGLGVLEGTFLFMLRGRVPASELLAGLLAYRVIYFFIPFVFGSLSLLTTTVVRAKRVSEAAR